MTENTQDKITDEVIEQAAKDDTPAQEQTPAVQPKEKKPALKAGGKLMGIIPQDLDEAWRLVEAMHRAGMTPSSYEVNGDPNATKARLMIGVMKGMEIGLPPVTALGTICIINNKPCLWGDGAVALVHSSGKIESMKSFYTGDDETKDDYTAHYIIKRKDQSEPVERTFSMGDAKRAKLLGKRGPWGAGYAKRMLMMRAQAWALRDGCADMLMGIGIAEEVRDTIIEDKREETNLSSLDDDFTSPTPEPAALEDKTDDAVYIDEAATISDEALEAVKEKLPAQGSLLSNADTNKS